MGLENGLDVFIDRYREVEIRNFKQPKQKEKYTSLTGP